MKIALALAVVAALTLSGCGGSPTAESTKTSSPSASPTPTPTPTETPDPAAAAVFAGLVLSPEGIGPILLGEAVPEFAPGSELVTWSDDFCGYGESYGNWRTVPELTGDGKWPFLAEVTYDGGTRASPVTHINVLSPYIRTAEGIGLGSTVPELQAAYGSSLHTAANDSFTPYWIEGSVGKLVFWVEVADPDRVFVMDVVPGFEDPEFSYTVSACA